MMQLVKKDYGNKVLALCELANNREVYQHAAKCANACNKKLMLQRIQQQQEIIGKSLACCKVAHCAQLCLGVDDGGN